jgi:hypothetical protein
LSVTHAATGTIKHVRSSGGILAGQGEGKCEKFCAQILGGQMDARFAEKTLIDHMP